jgi:uncharacterized membrane protein YedE/YeeE
VGELEGNQPPKYSKYWWHFAAAGVVLMLLTLSVWQLWLKYRELKHSLKELARKEKGPTAGVMDQLKMFSLLRAEKKKKKKKKSELLC